MHHNAAPILGQIQTKEASSNQFKIMLRPGKQHLFYIPDQCVSSQVPEKATKSKFCTHVVLSLGQSKVRVRAVEMRAVRTWLDLTVGRWAPSLAPVSALSTELPAGRTSFSAVAFCTQDFKQVPFKFLIGCHTPKNLWHSSYLLKALSSLHSTVPTILKTLTQASYLFDLLPLLGQ